MSDGMPAGMELKFLSLQKTILRLVSHRHSSGHELTSWKSSNSLSRILSEETFQKTVFAINARRADSSGAANPTLIVELCRLMPSSDGASWEVLTWSLIKMALFFPAQN